MDAAKRQAEELAAQQARENQRRQQLLKVFFLEELFVGWSFVTRPVRGSELRSITCKETWLLIGTRWSILPSRILSSVTWSEKSKKDWASSENKSFFFVSFFHCLPSWQAFRSCQGSKHPIPQPKHFSIVFPSLESGKSVMRVVQSVCASQRQKLERQHANKERIKTGMVPCIVWQMEKKICCESNRMWSHNQRRKKQRKNWLNCSVAIFNVSRADTAKKKVKKKCQIRQLTLLGFSIDDV